MGLLTIPGTQPVRVPRHPAERGQETLQTVMVVGFVLLPVLAAILTFGAVVHTSIGTQAAAAAGARSAGTSGSFGRAELTRVNDELQANGINAAACTVTATASGMHLGDRIAVRVSCPEHVGIPFVVSQDLPLHAEYVARIEVNQ